MHSNKLFLLLFFTLVTPPAFSQGVGVGQWRDHLPYTNAKTLTEAGDRIYCASDEALFYYSKSETTVERLSKINGLSDIGFSTINYDNATNTLVIAYENANIDLIQDNRIINIPDIKGKIIPGNKVINKVFFKDNYAYLACGFGIVVLDLLKKEIKDTYYIGPNGNNINVYDFTSDGSEFYAGTDDGVYHADVNASNLANFNFWTKYNTIPSDTITAIESFNNKIYANLYRKAHKDTIYVMENGTWGYFDTINFPDVRSITALHNKMTICGKGYLLVYDTAEAVVHNIHTYLDFADPSSNPIEAFATETTDIWIADGGQGLVKNTELWGYSQVYPNGPRFATAFDMSCENGELWVASGGVDAAWGAKYDKFGLGYYANNTWKSVYPKDSTGNSVSDLIRVAADPYNPRVFTGSWINGVSEITDGSQSAQYTAGNSALVNCCGTDHMMRIGGLAFDVAGNLWVASANVSKPIAVRKTNGTWKNFNPGNIYSPGLVSDIIVDSYDQKWVILYNGFGVLVFNDGGTIDDVSDDKYKKLNTAIGNGKLPSNFVYSIAEDLDGEIWMGTGEGIAVFYSPGELFSGNNFDSQQILIEQDGYAQYLFETEIVTTIAVDGGNRKWIGTQNAGVFLMSPDGTEELLHFTVDNSPLFSNNIFNITIDHLTGEVFIGTQKGIISYKGTATGGGEEFTDVYTYPNPVHHDYDGPIAIKGLVTNADIKITDITGNLVYATRAEGGQAVWSGKKLDGEKAATGVYLVFASNEDGTQTHVTKILIVN